MYACKLPPFPRTLPARFGVGNIPGVTVGAGVVMRLFHLFLRRAGVQPSAVRSPRSTSRLTVVCPREHLASVRRSIYRDLHSDGIQIAQLSIDYGEPAGMVRASVTVDCPPTLRPELMSRARRLQAHPGIHEIQWVAARRHALN